MGSSAQYNRRRAYRYAPPQVMAPVLSITHDGTRTRVDSVIDINLRGARVAFDGAEVHNFNSGQEVTVTLQAPGLDGSVDIGARVVFSAKQGQRHVIALVFISEPDLADRADGNFFSIFNRREDQRAASVAAITAMLMANRAASDDITGFEVKVINHSSKGIGFTVDETLDNLIRGREAVDLRIQTDSDEDASQHTARILHRVTRSDTIYYGCMFSA
jgi:hypothetical protein